MAIDAMETMYSVDIIDLKKQEKPKRISSFPVPKRYADNFMLLNGATLLYSFGWANDSKTLYFVSAVPPEEGEENVFGNLAIDQVNADGSNIKPLTDLRFSTYQANLSPNGKQMVYVFELEQELTIAKVDKAGIKKLNSSKVLSYCFRPIWSPNSKLISVYNSGMGYNFLILNDKKVILKKVPVVTSNFYLMIEQLKTENYFSADSKYVAFIKNYQQIPYLSALALLKDLKEEIQLKGNITTFRWSPSGNQLLLLESKERDQITQLTLYDCTTSSYTLISQDVQQIFDAVWSPDGKQILYSGTDSKTGQIVFKTSQADGSNQKLLFTFGENPLEHPISIEKIEKLVWLK
jgi:Tol biopolymer transport system component